MAIHATSTSASGAELASFAGLPAPVETPAPAPAAPDAAAAVPVEVIPSEAVAAQPQEQRRRRESPQDRIDRAVGKQREAERRAAAAEAELVTLRATPVAAAPVPASTIVPSVPVAAPVIAPAPFDKPKPELKSYDDIGAFTEAMGVWAAEKHQADLNIREAARVEATNRDRATQDLHAGYAQRLKEFGDTHPGFDATQAVGRLAAAQIPNHPFVEQHILHDEDGPALLDYLSTHLDEARRIAGMGNGPAIKALTKIALTFQPPVAAAPPAPATAVRPTLPPHPITPSGGSAVATNPLVEKGRMSLNDYKTMRANEIFQRKGRR